MPLPNQDKSDARSQSDKFRDLARELEADEDQARWDERLKKVAQAKPTTRETSK